jgi:hypothetical protein
MSKNDVVIKDLMEKVEQQKKDLGVKPRVAWITNGIIKSFRSGALNINTVNDASVLAEALAGMILYNNAFKEACDELGIESDCKIDGYSFADWKDDLKMRARIIAYDNKKKKLDATKTNCQIARLRINK